MLHTLLAATPGAPARIRAGAAAAGVDSRALLVNPLRPGPLRRARGDRRAPRLHRAHLPRPHRGRPARRAAPPPPPAQPCRRALHQPDPARRGDRSTHRHRPRFARAGPSRPARPDYGTCDGQPWSEVVARFGKIPARHPDLPIGPGAETWNHHYQRVRALLIRLLDHHDGQTIAVIAHGETITAAAHLFLNLPTSARADVAFAADNAALTIWEQQPLSWTRHDAGTRWALTSHNDTAHLTSPPQPRQKHTTAQEPTTEGEPVS